MWIFGDDPITAYRGLFKGAFGDGKAWARTIRKTIPFVFTGLSVAVAFKAGLFNIGASGQFVMGTVFSVWVGINFEGLPPGPARVAWRCWPVFWAACSGARFPGILKVTTGAHEVIVTIMLNYVAALFAGWTVYAGGTQGQRPGPLWDPTAGAISETPDHLRFGPIAVALRPALPGPLRRLCRPDRGGGHLVAALQDDQGL